MKGRQEGLKEKSAKVDEGSQEVVSENPGLF